jgi:hypothetical protein
MFINIAVRTPYLTCQILYFTAAINQFHLPKQNCKNKKTDRDKGMQSVHKHSTHPVRHSGMASVIILQKGPVNEQAVNMWTIYRVSQEECTILRESVPYVKLYRYNPKHLYPKLNGYGDDGQRSLKL